MSGWSPPHGQPEIVLCLTLCIRDILEALHGNSPNYCDYKTKKN